MAGALVPGWHFLVCPSCGARLGEYLMTLLGPLSAAAFAVLIAYVAVSHWTAPLWRLVAMALVALPAYLVASAAVNRIVAHVDATTNPQAHLAPTLK